VTGLIDGAGRPAYPSATVHLCELEPISGRELTAVQDRISRFAPSAEIIPGVRAVTTPGHTPGHTCFLVGSEENRVLCVGDTAYHHVISLEHPDWHFQIDRDPVATVPSRRAVLELAVTEDHTVLGYHWPFPGLARVKKTAGAFSATLV
jgi:glyoxylase-like metal-dependent hydrolase (beta-lactamase superfamily II)